MEKYDKKILRILKNYHEDATDKEVCLACSSSCCSYGAFAILENVIMIYEIYQKGELVREDYQFPKDMSFAEFVRKYFEVFFYSFQGWLREKNYVFFHMKSLSSDGHLISIPGTGNYQNTRHSFFRNNPWLNKGCIFLNKKISQWPQDDEDSSRHCILHQKESTAHLTAKPIDCVFHICVEAQEMKTPSLKMSKKWQKTLAACYPKSMERFLDLVDDKNSKKVFNKRKRKDLIAITLAVLCILLWCIPILGLLLSIFALITNERRGRIRSLLIYISLLLSVFFTSAALVFFLE